MKNLICFFFLLLTFSATAQISESLAKTILLQEAAAISIHPTDVSDVLITDNYTSRDITNVYFKQHVGNIEIHESSASIHGKGNNYRLTSRGLIQGIRNTTILNPTPISAEQAVARVSSQKGYAAPENVIIKSVEANAANKNTVLEITNVSDSDIPARLVYYLQNKGTLKLAWSLEIDVINSDDYFNFIVDAQTGEIIKAHNYTVYCSAGHLHNTSSAKRKAAAKKYEKKKDNAVEKRNNYILTDSSYTVLKWPIEAPHNGPRTVEVNPYKDNLDASPNGWHTIGSTNYTVTRGNNVDAYIDDNNSNGPTGGNSARANGGANMEFDFPLDTSMAPGLFKDAAVTNLFYWNNITHDVWYNYGFDEPSGNFQEINTHGMGGNASDYVRAEAQDGGGNCNANFFTPSDGSNPRMQMYLCNNNRDGDFDNGVIVHEYGHGISNRLTGGPAASGCLSNTEQMGEGWSDYFGIVMTIEPGDMGTDSRGMGTWLFEEGPNDPGIRPYPYSTDFNINPFTYDNIKSGVSVPHGLGSVWATMLWDLTWALIDVYGFDPDIYNGTGGNNIAMALVIQGLKEQPCSPGFVDGRDGILAADALLYQGANECIIWEAFAKRGLGFSASQGSSNSRSDGTEAFDVPPACQLELDKTVDSLIAYPGNNIVYTIKAVNRTGNTFNDALITDPLPANTNFVSASNGGFLDGLTNVVTWPVFTLPAMDSVTYTFTVQIDPNVSPNVADFVDDVESGGANWNTTNTGNSSWGITTTDASSGTSSWFAEDVVGNSLADLIMVNPLGVSNTSKLTFTHKFDTEVTYDGGVVEVSTNGGSNWIDQGANFITNGYNSTINNSRPAFSGDSNGFITSEVDLSPYVNQSILIRFRMSCDAFVDGEGWWIDDIMVDSLSLLIQNTANITAGTFNVDGVLKTPTRIVMDPGILFLSTSSTGLTCFETMDGTATVTGFSGTGTYTYLWDGGATTQTIDNLAAGSYGVTVDDGVDQVSTTVVVTQPDSLVLNMASTNAYGGPTGTAEVNPEGGTTPYTYLWNTGATTNMLTGLLPGTYVVDVSDANNCMQTDSVIITDPTSCAENIIAVNIQLDQFPGETTLTIRDGSNNILLQKNYAGEDPGALIGEFVCVPDACYTVEITDSGGDGLCNNGSDPMGYYNVFDGNTGILVATGCDFGNGVIENVCYPLLTATYTKTNPSCVGDADGSITIIASGGSGIYTYDFGSGPTGPTVNNLSAGTYFVTVGDGVTTVNLTILINESVATVFNTADSGYGSLRHAIANACLSDTIDFDLSLMGDTIKLQSSISWSGFKVINGLGINDIVISGNDITEIFVLPDSETRLSLLNLSLIDAEAPTNGGAIYNNGRMILENVRLKNNRENGVPLSWSGPGEVTIIGLLEIIK